ncbi:type II secretion system protein [Methylophaga pinxianii]|uniref:type II secretion system protein n=1 Tax=Methylophaga pinxianii TaxID=2881052 RepID=UPI001CF38C3D|nr:prepilin-type N-terminal cleavage/methylation domain-containing protein [Methylophaga pinxianii]MCB2426955.1 type II secretion system GspH family protein [Methylophaga pinxianii]UPH44839.1 type II secretion system GspH family protein [Methylophaga pinxianii]
MRNKHSFAGFTLIEILVVLTIIAILLTLVAPRYFDSVDRSKEKVLRHDLIVMRSAIDQYLGDRNEYPNSLQDLVDGRYLREVPVDPITDRRDTWVFSEPKTNEYEGSIADVFSGSPLISSEGTPYAEW